MMKITKKELESLPCIHKGINSLIHRLDTNEYGKSVVIKILKQDDPVPGEISRFINEFEMIKDIDVPGIRAAYEVGKIDGKPFIILEYIEGLTVKEAFVKQHKSLGNILTVMISATQALVEIHHLNIIHKNINSNNILVNPEEQKATIIDFSIATKTDFTKDHLIKPKEPEGILHYISPEQTGRMDRIVDWRTDFYSLGVVFYEMLTGKLPFETTNAFKLVHFHIAKPPEPVSKVNPDIPGIISDIVMKLMAKNAEDRYQSAYGLKSDLKICLGQLKKKAKIKSFDLARKDFSGRFQIPQKLYGREQEIQTIIEAFNRINKGTNETIMVSGLPGVGKSSLISEVKKYIIEKRGWFISGSHDQYQSNIPYSALTIAFTGMVNRILAGSAQQLTQWKKNIVKAVGTNRQLLIEMIPAMELIIGPQPPVREMNPTEAQHRFHNVFQDFIKAIAQKEHPLVLFIDNLQWVDIASVNFIKFLMTAADNQYLLFIGAYRDDETGPNHPLTMAVKEMEKARAVIDSIHLKNISSDALNLLISDSLQCQPDYSQCLSRMIYKKTGGNPFFAIRFLLSLHEEGALSFHFDNGKWMWDVSQIRGMNITDDMAAFFAQEVEKLPGDTKKILTTAACIGNTFSLKMLAEVARQSVIEISDSLGKAVEAGLIQPLDDNYKMVLMMEEEQHSETEINFEFSHKRIRDAAGSMISKKQIRLINLTIGRLKLKDTKEKELEENIYEITDHFNEGFRHIKEEEEQLRLAGLNLIAGQKAKNAAAFQSAIWYLSMGIGLLKPDKWDCHYELTLNLYTKAMEAEYLCSNFERAELLSGEILQHAKEFSEKIKVYELSILFYTAQNLNSEAIRSGLEALEILDISLPTDPAEIRIHIEKSYNELSKKIGPIKDLAGLPLMRDTHQLAAMRILMNMVAPVHKVRPGLLPVIVLKMVSMSVKHGNSPTAAFVYGSYAAILIDTFGDIEKGYRFGQLSMKMLEKFDTTELRAKVVFMFNTFVKHWKKPAAETTKPLLEVYQYGIETGDLEYAYYGAVNHCSYMFCTGASLEDIRNKQAKYLETTERFRLKFHSDFGKIWAQMVLNLMGSSSDPCQLKGELFDESEMLPVWKEQNNGILIFCAYCCRTILQYIFGKYADAIESARLAEEFKKGVRAFIYYPEHNFYYALALLAEYPLVDVDTKKEHLEKVDEIQEKFRQWASHAPMNFQHKYDLIEAEKTRVSGDSLKAMEFYGRALLGTRKYKYIQEKAVTYEREAEFYMGLGREEFAQICISNAYNSYREWGAMRKVAELEKKYMYLSINKTIISLDTETIIKASHALSQEIHLDRLLDKMMQIVIENAGAQKGILIQNKDNRLIIQAKGKIERKKVETMQAIPIKESKEIPLSIVNYAARTKTPIVLNDASQDSTYATDKYIIKHQPKSLMCLPIVHQNKLSGLLYLENNLTTNAFTPDRLKLLEALSAQVAISIENAGLYTNLEEKIKERELAEEALRESEERFRNLVESTSDWVWEVDQNGVYTYVNPNVCELLGYDVDELLGKTPFDFMPPGEAERIAAYFGNIMVSQKPITNLENINVHKDGHLVYLETSGVPFFSPNGELLGYRGIDRDITERKLFEQTLREKEERFRGLLTNIPGAIYRCAIDAHWTMHFISDVIEEISGYSASDFVQNKVRTFASIIHPGDREMVDKTVHDGLKRKGPYTIEYRIINADGSVHWVYERGQGVFGDSREALWLDGAVFDITERKQAEEILQLNEYRIKTRLKLHEMVWATEKEILDFSLEEMLNITESKIGYIAFMNEEETVLTMYSWTAGVMKECTVAGKPIIYPVENTGLWGEAVRRRKAVITNNYVAPNPLKKGIPDGHIKVVRHMNVPVFDGDKIVMVAGVGNKEEPYNDSDANQLTMMMSDTWQLVQKRRVEEELKKHREHLEELVKERTKELEAFSYSVSHDLRAPLRAIDGFSEILSDDYKDKLDEEAKRLINVIRKNTLNMNQLITDLLDFSRIGRQHVKTGEIDMKTLAREVFDELRQIYPKRNIKFKLGEIPPVSGDINLIRLVFSNLISNAIKFMGPRKIAEIEIGFRKKNKQLLYYVKDNGVGFEMDYIGQIFKVFQRLHSSKEFEGTGVGLAIVQKIIHKHGGEVIAEGEVDKGATFYFSLPKIEHE